MEYTLEQTLEFVDNGDPLKDFMDHDEIIERLRELAALKEQLRISRLNEAVCMCGSPHWAHRMGHEEHNFVENREPCEAEKELTTLRARIAALEDAARWRKWPEERPEVDGMCTVRYVDRCTGVVFCDVEKWSGGKWPLRIRHSVTHWRRIDLPEVG